MSKKVHVIEGSYIGSVFGMFAQTLLMTAYNDVLYLNEQHLIWIISSRKACHELSEKLNSDKDAFSTMQ